MTNLKLQSSRARILDVAGLAFWLLITFGVAGFASQFEPGDWYRSLAKPSWTPPGRVFGPVWGLLYLSMGIAAWMVWRQRPRTNTLVPLIFYLAQLAVNGLWSWLFFGQLLIGPALIDLLLLVLLVAVTVWLFLRVYKPAGFLMIPYLLWISFASALNFQIWRLN